VAVKKEAWNSSCEAAQQKPNPCYVKVYHHCVNPRKICQDVLLTVSLRLAGDSKLFLAVFYHPLYLNAEQIGEQGRKMVFTTSLCAASMGMHNV
jgi:hypothetical protein